jgi:predicted acetyltransferase
VVAPDARYSRAMTVEIRTIRDDEVQAYRDSLMATFGEEPESDEGAAERFRALMDPTQAWAAFDGATVVGTAGTFLIPLIVPGGEVLPMAGLTAVTVRPTHRRRGILRELMRLHLEDARRRALPVSGLWASEASIYGRFGYGVAAEGDAMAIERAGTIAFLADGELDQLEWLDTARARTVLPAIYARAVANRPGALVRSAAWWTERRFMETSFARHGASRRRHVLARRGVELVGYVQFRQRTGFVDGLPAGKVEIVELLGIDSRAEATLWKFALQVDLFPKVTWWNAPVDDTLAWMVTDPRRIARRRTDTLWLRIEDVPRTLAARHYTSDAVLRLRVDDETWELAVEGGRARCTTTTREPDLQVARAALGSLYLGGVSASRLARAERIHGDPAAIAVADRVFASPIMPWCPEVF